jgi:hypothetical protein
MLAIQSAAEAPPTTEGTPFTSWTAFVSRPLGSRASVALQPSSQRCRLIGWRPSAEAGSEGEANGPRRGACRSRLKIRERRPAITAAFREAPMRSVAGPRVGPLWSVVPQAKATSGAGAEVLGLKRASGLRESFTNIDWA